MNYTNGKKEANTFTLQLNTEFFSGSPACDGAKDPSTCQAWQQFIYSSTYGGVFMQYWLIGYDATCPGSWSTYKNDCYSNSAGSFLTSTAPSIGVLKGVSLTGSVAAHGKDSVVMEYGGNRVSAVGADSVVGLAGRWTVAEFALVGDGNGTAATFSAGTTLDVKTSVNTGATSAPTCDFNGFTAETNNLSFAQAPALSRGAEPAIETQQTSAGGSAGCAAAGTNKVTVTNPGHQTSTKAASVKLQLKASDSASGQTFAWSAVGLPSGLSINSSSGVISGKPTKAATSTVTVTAADKTGAKGTTKFTWTVNSPASRAR